MPLRAQAQQAFHPERIIRFEQIGSSLQQRCGRGRVGQLEPPTSSGEHLGRPVGQLAQLASGGTELGPVFPRGREVVSHDLIGHRIAAVCR